MIIDALACSFFIVIICRLGIITNYVTWQPPFGHEMRTFSVVSLIFLEIKRKQAAFNTPANLSARETSELVVAREVETTLAASTFITFLRILNVSEERDVCDIW